MLSHCDRLIFHCDCNNFFASCECLERPELWNVPMAVAGDPEKRTGVVVAKNELAKRFNVRTTDTVWQALNKCPDLVLVPPRHDYYADVSRRVNAIYREYTDFVEPASIDESYLDMTGVPDYLCTTPEALADLLRKRVREEIGISISVGVSFNKVFAKLGSDYKKPDATTLITRFNFRDILWPLPVGDLLYVGRASKQVLALRGISTIGDLAQQTPQLLTQWLGKGGEGLWRAANGLDTEPVQLYGHQSEVKSVSRGSTFKHDLTTLDEMIPALSPLADEVATQLRRHRLKGSVIQLQIKDPQLNTISRQMQLSSPTQLHREIMDCAKALLVQHWPLNEKAPIRAMTVGVTNLCPEDTVTEQISLFVEDQPQHRRENQEKLERAIDQIRNKLGKQAISMGFHTQDEA